jgi:dienelactone hydrolase
MLVQANKRGLADHRRAAVGFCFGGGNVLELARDGGDLAAAVSIHGDLKTALPAGRGAIQAALLVAHGAPDPVAPKADRDAFEAEMNAPGAKWQMTVFSGILHADTDQGADVPGVAAWDGAATRQTYALMRLPISSWPTPSRGGCKGRGVPAPEQLDASLRRRRKATAMFTTTSESALLVVALNRP